MVQEDFHFVPVCLINASIGIARTKRILSVEEEIGTTIPVISEVKHRIDHRGSIARLHAADIQEASVLRDRKAVGILLRVVIVFRNGSFRPEKSVLQSLKISVKGACGGDGVVDAEGKGKVALLKLAVRPTQS